MGEDDSFRVERGEDVVRVTFFAMWTREVKRKAETCYRCDIDRKHSGTPQRCTEEGH